MSRNIDSRSFCDIIQEGLVAFEPSPLLGHMIKFILKNQYEGVTMIDTEGIIHFLDRVTEEAFGLPPGGSRGKHFHELVPGSDLTEVARTGIAQIGRVQEVLGKKKIVSRFPLFHNGVLIGAVGKVVFQELEEIENLSRTVRKLKEKISSYQVEALNSNRAHYTFHDILGISRSIKRAKERARRLSSTDCTILLSGESGTGKELFAHSIHQSSNRKNGPFVRVNCGAIPFDLAESELFGYVKGAFTGSNPTGKKGKFEYASGGTIFLDEVASMPLAIQAMVLRVIQEKEIQPLGSSETREVNFRLIAATNQDLEKLVKEGRFRGDLYYRLSSVPCHIDPLRERPEDIPFLAQSLLPEINRKLRGSVLSINPEAIDILCQYSWPGNVRELLNVLEQSILNAYATDEINPDSLPSFLKKSVDPSKSNLEGIREVVSEAEKDAIDRALEMTNGNKKRAAELLGISRAALYNKLKRFNCYDWSYANQ